VCPQGHGVSTKTSINQKMRFAVVEHLVGLLIVKVCKSVIFLVGTQPTVSITQESNSITNSNNSSNILIPFYCEGSTFEGFEIMKSQ